MRKTTFLIIFFSLQNLNCSTNDNSAEFPELIFKRNNALLSSTLTFTNLALSIPLDYEQLTGEKFSDLEKKFESGDNNFFNVDLLSAYQYSNGQVIFISKILETEKIYNLLNEDYESGLIEILNASKTEKGQFLVNDQETVQYITANDSFINYRLFYNVKSKNSYIIDYFVPLKLFANLQSSLESSISTITINK